MTQSDADLIDSVIVTVICKKLGLVVDMRCPCRKPIELLGQEMLLLLADEYEVDVSKLDPVRISFRGRPILNGQTLAMVGAWDGSYLYIE